MGLDTGLVVLIGLDDTGLIIGALVTDVPGLDIDLQDLQHLSSTLNPRYRLIHVFLRFSVRKNKQFLVFPPRKKVSSSSHTPIGGAHCQQVFGHKSAINASCFVFVKNNCFFFLHHLCCLFKFLILLHVNIFLFFVLYIFPLSSLHSVRYLSKLLSESSF